MYDLAEYENDRGFYFPLEEYIYGGQIKYSRSVKGINKFSKFMAEKGYIKESYKEDNVIYNGE